MKRFTIRVDSVTYSVWQNAKFYHVLENGTEILKLRVTVGKNVAFYWETEEGHISHIINKIGLAIELHDIARYV